MDAVIDASSVKNFFSFLRDFSLLNTKRIKKVTDYGPDSIAIYWSELPDDVRCAHNLDEPENPIWLRVEKPELKDVPPLPLDLHDWLDMAALRDETNIPELFEEIKDPAYAKDKDSKKMLYLEDRSYLIPIFNDYLESWLVWAAEKEQERRYLEVYNKLFLIADKLENNSEDYEAVLGVGFVAWSEHQGIRHPAVFNPAAVRMGKDGAIEVTADDLTLPIYLEQNILPVGTPNKAKIDEIQNGLRELSGPFDPDIHDVLEKWVNAIDSEGEYSQDLKRSTRDFDNTIVRPLVAYSPMLLLRKRDNRGVVKAFDGIAEKIDDGEEIPAGILDLLSAVNTEGNEKFEWDDEEQVPKAFIEHADALFAKESNEQQLEIIEKLRTHRGVVVQGPPGTGKTHTIANLITHSLANGKRVLVTSHKSHALSVLKDQLPEGIAKLTVSILGDGKQGANDLKVSAQTLLDRQNDVDFREPKRKERIEQYENGFKQVLKDIDTAIEEIATRKYELNNEIEFATGYFGRAAAVIERLKKEEKLYEWFKDEVRSPFPLSPEELVDLFALIDDGSLKDEFASRALTEYNEFLRPDEFENIVTRLTELHGRQSTEAVDGDVWSFVTSLPAEELEEIQTLLKNLETAKSAASKVDDAWTVTALEEVENGRVSQWESLGQKTDSFLDTHSQIMAHQFDSMPKLEIAQLKTYIRLAKTLQDYLAQGKKLTGIFGSRSKEVKAAKPLIDFLNVNGELLTESTHAGNVKDSLEQLLKLKTLEDEWSDKTQQQHEGRTFSDRVGKIQDNKISLNHVLAVVQKRVELNDTIGGRLIDPVDNEQDVQDLRMGISIYAHNKEFDENSTVLEQTQKQLNRAKLQADQHKTVGLLAEAANSRNTVYYTECYLRVHAAHKKIIDAHQCLILLGKLESAAPALYESLRRDVFPNAERTKIEAAWNWSLAKTATQEMAQKDTSALREDYTHHLARKHTLIGEMAAELAWDTALSRITHEDSVALKAYGKSISKIGKGKGKYVGKHQAEAQSWLNKAREAVPAWIMPVSRVVDNFEMRPNMFDLVIVDEASQSGIEALFLMWIGKQIVVVGDNEQISPEYVGVNKDQVSELKKKYLTGIKLADFLDTDSSLFDFAHINFATDICLKEHFRCMPEIIEFSNRLCYSPNKRLDAVRQHGSKRLHPVKESFVPGGRYDRKALQNPKEAQAIVDQIISCHEDPAYENKTFGVINLFPGAKRQHEKILLLLREQLGVEAIAERKLLCGTSREFQGTERDVIFLSMADTPKEEGGKVQKLGDALGADTKRFNVAASRAKDQMWLFHSVSQEQLNPECLRFKLLNFCQSPPPLEYEAYTKEVSRTIAQKPPFDSLYEQKIFRDITDKGYAAVPQVAVNGYSIDIVVLGDGGKLAVECDGDYWHKDKYFEDLYRQDVLERQGWQFFRINDLVYNPDPEEALKPLWKMLSDRGIYPIGQGPPPAPDNETNAGETDETHSDVVADEIIETIEKTNRKGDSERIVEEVLPNVHVENAPKTAKTESATRSPKLNVAKPSEPAEMLRKREIVERIREKVEPKGQSLSEVIFDATGEKISGSYKRYKSKKWRLIGLSNLVTPDGKDRYLLFAADFNDKHDIPYTFRVAVDVANGSITPVDKFDEKSQQELYSVSENVVKKFHKNGDAVLASKHVEMSELEYDDNSALGIPEPEGPNSIGMFLAPYTEWAVRDLPNQYEVNSAVVANGLAEIVEAEGPMLARSAYKRYLESQGLNKLGKALEKIFNIALGRAVTTKLLEQYPDGEALGPEATIYITGTDPVVLRKLGPREVYDVPQSELRVLIESCSLYPETERKVADVYGKKLTKKLEDYVSNCWRPND